jgi:hypothetical protein
MMDSHYQPIYRQAAAAQNLFHNYSHTMANDPQARVLRNEIHKLTNDIASSRNPRLVEQRVRNIQNQLGRMQRASPEASQSSLLNLNQSQRLRQDFESMRRNISMHPKF